MFHLNIQSRGIVKSGFVEYDFGVDGTVVYNVSVNVQIAFFIRKTFAVNKSYKLPPASLMSANFVPGVMVALGLLNVTVLSVHGNIALVNLAMPGIGAGSGVLDLSGPIVKVQSLDLKGTVSGFNIEIVCA